MSMQKKDSINSRYQLRYAAGMYWLLDMEQSGMEYKKPFCMNETGAEIWKGLSAGESVEVIVKRLGADNTVSQEEITNDVREYQKQLIALGILANEG